MKILLLTRYERLGASSRIRFYQYISYLKVHGIDVIVSPLLGDDYLHSLYSGRVSHLSARIGPYLRRSVELLKARRFDLLWIEKELFPWFPAWAEMILARLGIPYIVDYDDAIFHRYDAHSKMLIRKLLGNKIDAVMRHAALVIAGNEYLMERAKKAGAKRVEYLPTVVDLERYHINRQNDNKVFSIGWIGSPITAKYIYHISEALAEVCKDRKVRLILVGSGQISLDDLPIEIRSWSEETEVNDLQGFDVGIMPLPDSPWEQGKCGYKIIQYMACALPVVASPVGINKKLVQDGVNGFLASTKEEWIFALNTLKDNHSLREKIGLAGRNKVESEYCIQVTAPRLVSLLKSVMSD